MKAIKNILLIAKGLMYWFYIITFNLGIIAFIGYNVMIYFIYGSMDPYVIKSVLESNGISMAVGFALPFGIPYFISFFGLFGDSTNKANTSALDNAIAHRNNMMSHKDDNKAFEIYQKTAHLDATETPQQFTKVLWMKNKVEDVLTIGIGI
jgi:hypothetical protein